MKTRWLFLGLALMSCAACSDVLFSANSDRDLILQGVVRDQSTGTPLAEAFVSLEWIPNDSSSTSATRRVDVSTSDDGSYRLETKLGNVICSTLVLFIGKAGYKAIQLLPECKGGVQVFNADLQPN